MLVKLGEAINITAADIQPADVVLADPDILERFKKFAQGLKTVAPKAKDFLYFTAIMMHAAEASLLDGDGSFKKDASGNPVDARWEKVGEGIRWVCSNPNIKPYKNSNNDIFPEEELIKAHKKWIGRPLCLDHKSSSVDFVRGVIVDTYYDRKHKRVIALCALDKISYPELAHKVSTGVSASVSMGTAVGRAVCSDCQRVARVESDFCDHMRRKSCYGEINLDLSPIELSIVVNGADPKAQIKHIIASDLSKAASHLQDYLDGKLSKGEVSDEELAALKLDLAALSQRVDALAESKDDSNDTQYGTTGSKKEMAEPAERSVAELPPNGPEPIALWASHMDELRTKLSNLEKDLNQLITMTNKTDKGINMPKNEKTAYYQGGGGVNEPTPGTPKYEKEDYETIRDTQDKQMVGQGPFPGVGPVDGMHPGYDSFGETEEARKRRLQRLAGVEERRMRRAAALEKAKENFKSTKEAYYLGTEEPKPGQVQYPNETDYRQIRDSDDKQMVGAPPFPGVGPVDGLYGDDLKKKEMLSRASLKAKFVKAAKPDGRYDLANSRWDVYADKNLILSASVKDLTGGEPTEAVYSSIATKDFGLRILSAIKSHGFEKAKAALLKSAQPAPAMGAPGAPADAAPAPMDMPGGDMGGDLDEPMSGGAPEDSVAELVEKVKDAADETMQRADDLAEAVKAMQGETSELAEVPPADESAFGMEGKSASVSSLQSMRKTLNSMLTSSMKEAIANLRAHGEELKLTAGVYASRSQSLTPEQRKYLDSLATDAVDDAKTTLADSLKLMSAYVKYANGTENLLKRANVEGDSMFAKDKDDDDEDEDEKKGKKKDDDEEDEDDDNNDADVPAEGMDVKPGEIKEKTMPMDQNNVDLTGYEERGAFDPAGLSNLQTHQPVPPGTPVDTITPNRGGRGSAIPKGQPHAAPSADPNDPLNALFGDEAANAAFLGAAAKDGIEVELPGGGKASYENSKDIPPGSNIMQQQKAAAGLDLSTKEGRAQYRVKLAQQGVQFSDMIGRAHPKGGHTPEKLDTKPTGDLADVETIIESKEKHMAVVNTEPKARKQAEKIQSLVSSGKLAADQVDGLVAHGVDPAAVKYWKAMWGEAGDSESKEFAAKLVQEHGNQKMAEAMEKQEVRIKRAYDLAYEMRDRGIISGDQIKTQVGEILKWNDEAFESTKRIVAKHAMTKQAMPQVGLLHSGDVILPAAEKTASEQSLVDVFDDYFKGRRF